MSRVKTISTIRKEIDKDRTVSVSRLSNGDIGITWVNKGVLKSVASIVVLSDEAAKATWDCIKKLPKNVTEKKSCPVQVKNNLKDSELEIGGVYRNRKGEDYILIGIGYTKKKKYLAQWIHSIQKSVPPQKLVDANMECMTLNLIPNWNYTSCFSVVEKIGMTNVPDGMSEAFDKKVKQVQASATEWNRVTSNW